MFTITVFTTTLEQNRQHSCQSSTKPSEANVKDTPTSHIDNKIFLTFLLTPYLYTFSLYEVFTVFRLLTDFVCLYTYEF
jgi:hypothetical protein